MLKRQLGTLFLVTCLILTTVPNVLGGESGHQSGKIITVAGDGSGDYKCDGNDDHVQINQALEKAANSPGTIVHLKGPFTYEDRRLSSDWKRNHPRRRFRYCNKTRSPTYLSGEVVEPVYQKRRLC